ncbi:hypothetical protein HK102_000545, partial [Quaeritorhiza haematococci]
MALRLAAAIVTTGLTFEQIRRLFLYARVFLPFSEAAIYCFHDAFLQPVIANERNNMIDENVRKYCTRTRRSQLPQMVGGLIGGTPLKGQDDNEQTFLYVGNAKSYKSFGAGQIAKKLKDAKVLVATVVKDDDANTIIEIQRFHPNVSQVLDEGHVIKNIPKKVKAKAKEKGYEQLKGRDIQLQQQVRRQLKYIKTVLEEEALEDKQHVWTILSEITVQHLQGR